MLLVQGGGVTTSSRECQCLPDRVLCGARAVALAGGPKGFESGHQVAYVSARVAPQRPNRPALRRRPFFNYAMPGA